MSADVQMLASLVGPLEARAQLLLRRCLTICDDLTSFPQNHAIHHVRKCYKRVLGVYASINGQEQTRSTTRPVSYAAQCVSDVKDTSYESLDSFYARIFGFDPADPLFQYESWEEPSG